MPSNASSAAVLLTPRLGSPPAVAGSSSSEIPRRAPTVGTTAVDAVVFHPGLGRAFSLRRVFSALGDFAGIIAIALAFPLVILAVGIPIALLVRLAIWTVRALSGW